MGNMRDKLKVIRRIGLKSNNFSIICNNCWGGTVYQYFGLEYQSPTAGLIIPPADFNLFCSNIRKYIDIECEPLNLNDAKNKSFFDELQQIHNKKLIFGKCADVEICFLHYSTFEEASVKWTRRMKRLNLDNLIFKTNDNNYLTKDQLIEWCEIVRDKNAIFITNNEELYELATFKKILYKTNFINTDFVDDTTRFNKDHNIKRLLMSSYNRLKGEC